MADKSQLLSSTCFFLFFSNNSLTKLVRNLLFTHLIDDYTVFFSGIQTAKGHWTKVSCQILTLILMGFWFLWLHWTYSREPYVDTKGRGEKKIFTKFRPKLPFSVNFLCFYVLAFELHVVEQNQKNIFHLLRIESFAFNLSRKANLSKANTWNNKRWQKF